MSEQGPNFPAKPSYLEVRDRAMHQYLERLEAKMDTIAQGLGLVFQKVCFMENVCCVHVEGKTPCDECPGECQGGCK